MKKFDPTVVEKYMEHLNRITTEEGKTPSWAINSVASQLDCSTRSVWSWLKQHQNPKPKQSGQKNQQKCRLTEEMLQEVAMQQGKLNCAWKSLNDTGRYKRSYRQFCREFATLDPIVREGLTRGVSASIAKGIYLKVENLTRGARVAYDHAIANVFVQRTRAGVVETFRPYVSVIIDHATRFCHAFVITEGDGIGHDPGTETVVTMFGSAIRGRTVDDEEGTFVGGVPTVVQFANAKAHTAEAMLSGFTALGISSHAITPRSPWQNGRVERFIQTMENELFLHLPGATEALEDRRDTQWDANDCDTIEVFAVKLQQWIDHYNYKRVHSELGCTPFESWKRDCTPITRVDDTLLRHVFLAETNPRMVSKSGIRFRNIDYVHPLIGKHPKHGSLVGRRVTLRYLPNDRSFVDIYLDDEFICTAVPHTRLTSAERLVIVRQRNARVQEVDTILKETRDRALAEALDGNPQFQPERDPSAPSFWPEPDESDFLEDIENALGLTKGGVSVD